MVLVGLHLPEPIWMGRFMDRISAVMTTYLADENIRAYPDTYVQSTLSAYDFFADVVKEVDGEKGRIGVEMGGYYYPAKAHADLSRALPEATFIDADVLVNWVRIVKSPAEIAIMREAGLIADATMQKTIEMIEPGVRECDIAATVYHAQMTGTAKFGGSYACTPPNLCVGERQIAPHAAWTDDPLPDTTFVNLELFGNRHRYQVVLSRSIAVGKVAPAYHDLAKSVVEALNAGLDAVRPGQTASDVEAAFRRTLARHGFEKEARLGYSIGVGFLRLSAREP